MPSVQLQILSDLHLETPATRPTYFEFEFEPQCPYLALLGDIGLVSHDSLFGFLEKQLERFRTVLYVLGNHEPYDSTFASAKQELGDFANRIRQQHGEGRFVLLDQTRFDITPEVTILGCTLFSAIAPEQIQSVQFFVTDFERIADWTPDDHIKAHQAGLAWLNDQVRHIEQTEPHRTIAILTHHSPTISEQANNPRHLEDASETRSAFMTDLSNEPCWTSPTVKLWAFGHTHFNCDFVDRETGKRVLANQRGYARSTAEGFDAEKVVEL